MHRQWSGTRMAPSAGHTQRLMTEWVRRWFMAIMMPAPATTSTPWQSARPAIFPRPMDATVQDRPHSMPVFAAALVANDDGTNALTVALSVVTRW